MVFGAVVGPVMITPVASALASAVMSIVPLLVTSAFATAVPLREGSGFGVHIDTCGDLGISAGPGGALRIGDGRHVDRSHHW